MKSIFRAGIGVLALVALPGCYSRGENLPLEVAKYRVMTAEVQRPPAVTPAPVNFPTEVMRVGTGLWQVGFRDYDLPQRSVRPVGSADSLTFYALSWDNEPFDRLLVPVPGRPNRYREFLSVY